MLAGAQPHPSVLHPVTNIELESGKPDPGAREFPQIRANELQKAAVKEAAGDVVAGPQIRCVKEVARLTEVTDRMHRSIPGDLDDI